MPYAPTSSFNQQGSFDAGSDSSVITATKKEAREQAKKGNTAAADKLARQASGLEYGAARPPEMPQTALVSIDNAYMNKLAKFAGLITRTDNKSNIMSYIGSINHMIPEPWKSRGKDLWQMARPGDDVWKSPEMRERNRVVKVAQQKYAKGRERSQSFANPPEQPKRQRTVTSHGAEMDTDTSGPGKGGN